MRHHPWFAKVSLFSVLFSVLLFGACPSGPGPNAEAGEEKASEKVSEKVTTENTQEPQKEKVSEPVSEPKTEPSPEPTSEPKAEKTPEPVSEPKTEPAPEPQSEPVTESVPDKMVVESVPQPKPEPTKEKVVEAAKPCTTDADCGKRTCVQNGQDCDRSTPICSQGFCKVLFVQVTNTTCDSQTGVCKAAPITCTNRCDCF